MRNYKFGCVYLLLFTTKSLICEKYKNFTVKEVKYISTTRIFLAFRNRISKRTLYNKSEDR